MACRRQLFAQFDKIVDFAIEDDRISAVTASHRLPATGTQIENREPAMEQYEVGIGFNAWYPLAAGTQLSLRIGQPTCVVGAAMVQQFQGSRNAFCIELSRTGDVSCNTTHTLHSNFQRSSSTVCARFTFLRYLHHPVSRRRGYGVKPSKT